MGTHAPEQVPALLSAGLAAMGLELPADRLGQLAAYCAELRKWSRKMNLVARAPDREIVEKHFLDSLTLLPLLAQAPGSLLDVGTGAGFPGLALKIACPAAPVTLMEPRLKRVSFLKHVIRTLGLQGVKVAAQRLEPAGVPQAGSALRPGGYPWITSRAFTSVAEFLSLTAPFSPAGGKVVCMKGRRSLQQMEAWRQEAERSPYQLLEVKEWQLPFSGDYRCLLVFQRSEDAGTTS